MILKVLHNFVHIGLGHSKNIIYLKVALEKTIQITSGLIGSSKYRASFIGSEALSYGVGCVKEPHT